MRLSLGATLPSRPGPTSLAVPLQAP